MQQISTLSTAAIVASVKSKVPWFDIADTLTQYPEIVDLRELAKG